MPNVRRVACAPISHHCAPAKTHRVYALVRCDEASSRHDRSRRQERDRKTHDRDGDEENTSGTPDGHECLLVLFERVRASPAARRRALPPES